MRKAFRNTTIALMSAILLVSLGVLLVMSGCSKPKVTLIISVKGEGTTTPAPGQHEIVKNTVVTLKVKPNSGSTFSHWDGPDSSAVTDSDKILMDKDRTLTAVFVEAEIGIHTQPVDGVAGQIISGESGYPTVKVTAPEGTPLSGIKVTASVKSGAPLSGTLTKKTDATGLAVFNDLVMMEEGHHTLVFSCPGLRIESNSIEFDLAGAGTEADPYLIHNIYGLNCIKRNLSAVYHLVRDVDASTTKTSGTLYWNDGKGWQPINNFSGTLEGNSHKIKNLYINRPNDSKVGLFGNLKYPDQAIIGNLNLVDIDITGLDYVGALIGYMLNQPTMQNCSVSGTVTGSTCVGGLLGYAESGAVSKCSSSADVTGIDAVGGLIGNANPSNVTCCYASGDVVASNSIAGGLAGIASYDCVFSNCYSWADVSASSEAGGFVGMVLNFANFFECYAAGKVTGDFSGGFASTTLTPGVIRNCFFDSTVCGYTYAPYEIEAKITEELKDPDTYDEFWDRAVWNIVAGQYPTLKP